eukprot:3027764-Rhodomonas_salina.1
MHCPATEAARHRAHDRIADPLLASVASLSDTGWQYWLRPVAWKISSLLSHASHPPRCRGGWDPDNPPRTTEMAYHLWLHTHEAYQCPPSIAAFTPDGLLYDHRSKRLILYEFSRCMGTKPGDLDQRHTEKAQAYHELRLYLSLLLPEYSVELVTFVMTISGSIPVTMWDV